MDSVTDTFLKQPLEHIGSQTLRALWQAAHGNWKLAHEEAQAGDDADAAWVHALLHREEGDNSNARYWYSRAGKPFFRGTIEQERDEMIAALLSASTGRNVSSRSVRSR